jgi:cytochrome c oxidase subunit 4
MSAHSHSVSSSEEKVIPKANTAHIWRVFWILLVITSFELVVGMFVAPHHHDLKTTFAVMYIVLTLVKAYYIVAEFMHLGHETKTLIWSVLLPLVFLIWLIIAMFYEGAAILAALQGLAH